MKYFDVTDSSITRLIKPPRANTCSSFICWMSPIHLAGPIKTHKSSSQSLFITVSFPRQESSRCDHLSQSILVERSRKNSIKSLAGCRSYNHRRLIVCEFWGIFQRIYPVLINVPISISRYVPQDVTKIFSRYPQDVSNMSPRCLQYISKMSPRCS